MRKLTGQVLFLIVAPVLMFRSSAADDHFEDVAAIFESRCVSCHNAQEANGSFSLATAESFRAGGDSGAVVVNGNPDGSLLIELISGPDPEMPKSGEGLTEAEIAVVRNWIAAGAPWPNGRSLTDRSRPEGPWWSLKPLEPVEIPDATDSTLVNPIDHFVRAKLRARGLEFSPEADRRTLIRRLTFDLTGLPPTLAEVEQFCADTDSLAYEKLVDRLLASPQYGERWARHWLDVVHYGETHGYDKDQPRLNAWPYRDYVIRAFNQDKPYARFIQEQIAGDVLFPDTVDGIVALGFIAAGPWDFIGHAELPETKIDGKVARHLDRDDMVSNAINTFQSVTVHCAQCHNHRFDPISQEDYYALQANFAALDRTDRKYFADPDLTRRHRDLVADQRRLSELQTAIESEGIRAAGEALKSVDASIAQLAQAPDATRPEFGYHSEISAVQDVSKWVQVDLQRAVVINRVVLKPAFDDFNQIGAGFGFPVRFRIDLADDPAFQMGVQSIAEFDQEDYPNPGVQPQNFPAAGATGRYLRITATRLSPRQGDFIFALAELEITDSLGENVARKAIVTALDSIEAPPRWSKSNLIDSIAPTRDQKQELEELQRQRSELLLKALAPEKREELNSIKQQLSLRTEELKKFPEPAEVYVATVHTGSGNFVGTGANGGRPRAIHLLERGDVTRPGRAVAAGALSCISSLPSRFELEADAGEGARRAALAGWLSDRRNPLTWRSITNRVWQYHFGRGIVETPNDFGRMGAEPTHPELLDWLAVWFRDEADGSLKQLHKLIVTSQTYRQTSSPPKASFDRAGELDGSNTLLWRQNRRKLEAEAIRDCILLAAGKLDLTPGGPSFQDFVITHPEHSPHYEYHLVDPEDPRIHRRSIYRFIVRSQQQPWLSTLDCADPSLLVDRRNQTITPLQALAQLNNELSLAMAVHFAARVARHCSTIEQQIEAAFQIAFQRAPSDVERQELKSFAELHGMVNTCRLLMNLNEFVFVD